MLISYCNYNFTNYKISTFSAQYASKPQQNHSCFPSKALKLDTYKSCTSGPTG